jgi:integrase
VYPDDDGSPKSPEAVSKTFERLVKGKTTLPYYSFHALRHTHASILIAEKWQAKDIQARLGHATIGITMDTYGHLFPGHDTEAVGKLDAAMGF